VGVRRGSGGSCTVGGRRSAVAGPEGRSLGQAAVNAGSAEAIEEYELPVIMIFVPEVA